VILRFLGTGTSFGVPVIGCRCDVCRSPDPRDRRTRHAAVLEEDGRRLLVDTPPELRLQLVGAGIREVDAVFYTHTHADHVHGVDDLRVFSERTGSALPVYAAEQDGPVLLSRFGYVFDPSIRPVAGTSKPELELRHYRSHEPVTVAGFELLPLPVPHGYAKVHGFRTGPLGYVTDAKSLPPRTEEALRGVRVLVLNALWFDREHPTHFSVNEAVAVAESLGVERTYLTHLSHLTSAEELDRRLPPGVFAAYDGLQVEI
jgi:phosphoribosyl 1,2-cyclic phosphate phosphodiesterase